MSKPQQPELRRSGFVAALDPDATASEVEARRRPTRRGDSGPVPEDNRPGHHPVEEQDKPSGDRFLAKIEAVNGSSNGGGRRDAAGGPAARRPGSEPGAADHLDRSGALRIGMVAAGAVGAAVGVVRAVRNRTPLG